MKFSTPPDIALLRGPVPLAHLFIDRFVHAGDQVIDATCGNGHDTLRLAELVGPGGRVWAFDIQQAAIDETAARLAKAGLSERVVLIHAGHETMAACCRAPVTAVMFNLGYRPGGDRDLITRPASTLTGMEQALELLAAGGILTLTIYPGHAGGAEERAALEQRLSRLSAQDFHVWRMGQMNVPVDAPYSMLIQKVR